MDNSVSKNENQDKGSAEDIRKQKWSIKQWKWVAIINFKSPGREAGWYHSC